MVAGRRPRFAARARGWVGLPRGCPRCQNAAWALGLWDDLPIRYLLVDPGGSMMVAGQEREPFKPGHELSLKHGANSERVIAERAKVVHSELLTHAPYLAEERFIPAVNRYLRAASREALLDDWIRVVCDEKGAGAIPARTWEQATANARLAAKLGSDLGLDPIGHARIRALSVGAEASAASLDQLSATGRAIRERAEARIADATVVEEAAS
jgi:hypothetical protein